MMGGRRLRWGLAVLAAMVAGGFGAAPAPATTYADIDRRGPPLKVPTARLEPALRCTDSVVAARQAPVLLVPGTSVTPDENYGWNYVRAFVRLDRPLCTIELPHRALSDVQISAEYIVYAIRRMFALAGRRIAILGASQGGMSPRWALRFWPDTRRMVDDVVGLAGTNHGSHVGNLLCTPSCPAAVRQQITGARFIEALNSGKETFAGISYTMVYSHYDQVVQPNLDDRGTSSLHNGAGQITNVALQDVCPGNVADHFAIGTYDPVGYALLVDALTHVGPADPSRVDRSVCNEVVLPGVDAATFPSNYTATLAAVMHAQVAAPRVSVEPPLACYTTASCPPVCAAREVTVRIPRRHHRRARRVVLRLDGQIIGSWRRRSRIVVRLPATDDPAGVAVVTVLIRLRGGRTVTRRHTFAVCG